MMELRLLGPVEVNGEDGRDLEPLRAQPKRFALLAYLALPRPGTFYRRDTLLALLWPDLDQSRARSALRKILYYLRRTLRNGVVVTRGNEEIGLDPQKVWCDVAAFEEAVERGDLEAALRLYRGDLLEGFFLSNGPEFEEWLEAERTRLKRQAVTAAWTLAESKAQGGERDEATRYARRAVALAPDDETGIQRLIKLLDGLGDRGGALREYRDYAKRFREEFESEPSPETQALITAVRARAEANEISVVAESHAEEPAAELTEPGDDPTRHGGDLRYEARSRARWRIPALVAGLAVVFVAVFVGQRSESQNQGVVYSWMARSKPPPSLVILPFTPPSADSVSVEFVRGLMAEMVGNLSRVAGLRTLSYERAALLHDAGSGPIEIADSLGASAVLSGTVRRQGGSVRIVATLLDRATEEYIWSGTYEAPLDDVFVVQADMANDIASALSVELTAPLKMYDRKAGPATEAAALIARAVDLYLFGVDNADAQSTAFAHRDALVDSVIGLDPSNADAWALKAKYSVWNGWQMNLNLMDSAISWSERALQLGPGSHGYHAAGMVFRIRNQMHKGFTLHQSAVELDPNSGLVGFETSAAAIGRLDVAALAKETMANRNSGPLHRNALARISVLLGDYESADRWFSALEPLLGANSQHAGLALLAGFPDSAEARLDRVLAEKDLHDRSWFKRERIGRLYIALRQFARAQSIFEALPDAPEWTVDYYYGDFVTTNLGFTRLMLGDTTMAERLFQRSMTYDDSILGAGADWFAPRYDKARVHALRGETRKALRWLEEAVDVGWRYYYNINSGRTDPMLASLYGNRRFERLMDRVKNEVDSMLARLDAM